MSDHIGDIFKKELNSEPDLLISSPGRINLIGEHTDYNDGLVMPAAIDKELFLGFSANGKKRARIISVDYNEQFECDVDLVKIRSTSWAKYLESIIVLLNQKGFEIGGFNLVLKSNIPAGAGLSSSAALNCGIIHGLSELFSLNIPSLDVARMAQTAEHAVGLNCGIMDQFAVVFGEEDSFLKLDCRDYTYQLIPAEFQDHSLVLFDTKVKHELTDSAYNDRRRDCEHVLAVVQSMDEEVRSVRDITTDHLDGVLHKVSSEACKRIKFVIEENERVLNTAEMIRKGDFQEAGKLMSLSHQGLSEDYEVSCEESDFLVHQICQHDNVMGARQMGGGFGGCIISLIQNGHGDELERRIFSDYKNEFGKELGFYEVKIGKGLRRIE